MHKFLSLLFVHSGGVMRSIIALTVIFLAGAQTGTPVLDLTSVTARDRLREPMTSSASGGGVGGNGQVAQEKGLLAVTVLSAKMDGSVAEASVIFEVEIKNISNRKIDLPVNPNLGDFEPERADVPYTYTSCYITLRFEGQGHRLLDGLSLYGSTSVTSSMKELNPGEAVRIRARAHLKSRTWGDTSQVATSSRVIAVLLLQQNSVKEQNGVLHQDARQAAPEVTSSNAVDLAN
jgi:hypothetical protein